jgi:putative redox protein
VIRSSSAEIEGAGEAEVQVGGRSFRIRKEFLDDLSAVNMRDAVSGLGRALLVCHSPDDRTVGIDNATEIFVAARHPKCFLSLDSADHLCSDPTDAHYAGRMIATWAGRYLEGSRARKP